MGKTAISLDAMAERLGLIPSIFQTQFPITHLAFPISDVKLFPGETDEGPKRLLVQAWDLCLDANDRRSEDTTPLRRALVHDFQDGLTVNWANDYPGGVTINGPLKVPGAVEGDLKVDGKILLRFTGISANPAIQSSVVHLPGGRRTPGQDSDYADLGDLLLKMSDDIIELKRQISTLTGRNP